MKKEYLWIWGITAVISAVCIAIVLYLNGNWPSAHTLYSLIRSTADVMVFTFLAVALLFLCVTIGNLERWKKIICFLLILALLITVGIVISLMPIP